MKNGGRIQIVKAVLRLIDIFIIAEESRDTLADKIILFIIPISIVVDIFIILIDLIEIFEYETIWYLLI